VLKLPRLVGLALIFQTIFLVSAVFLSRYLNLDVMSSISDVARDNHCSRDLGEGFGVHCFGDYFSVATLLREGSVWSLGGASNYPPTALLPFLGGLLPEALLRTAPNLGFYGFLLFLVAGFITVALWATRGKSLAEKLLALVVIGPFAAPALVAIDRGNSAGLLAAPLLLFAAGFLRNRPVEMMFGALISSMIKPQFALLFFALLLVRYYAHFVIGLLILGATNFFGFLLDAQHFPQNVVNWSGSVIGYSAGSAGHSPEGTHPPNQSIVRGLDLLFLERIPWLWLVAVIAILAVSVTLVLSISGDVVDRPSILVFLLVVGSLGPPTAWMYYLVFAQVLLALHWRGLLLPPPRSPDTLALSSSLPSTVEKLSLLAGVLGSVAVFVLPPVNDAQLGQPLTSWNFLPSVWVIWLGSFLVRLAATVIRNTSAGVVTRRLQLFRTSRAAPVKSPTTWNRTRVIVRQGRPSDEN